MRIAIVGLGAIARKAYLPVVTALAGERMVVEIEAQAGGGC
jgi:hypothetical protein